MKVRYTGTYDGYVPLAHRIVKRGEIFTVQSVIGRRLISTGQFEEVKAKKKPEQPKGGD